MKKVLFSEGHQNFRKVNTRVIVFQALPHHHSLTQTVSRRQIIQERKVLTLSIWRAFSITPRSFCSDNKELLGLPGAIIFFSLNFETNIGSKSMKTSL